MSHGVGAELHGRLAQDEHDTQAKPSQARQAYLGEPVGLTHTSSTRYCMPGLDWPCASLKSLYVRLV